MKQNLIYSVITESIKKYGFLFKTYKRRNDFKLRGNDLNYGAYE